MIKTALALTLGLTSLVHSQSGNVVCWGSGGLECNTPETAVLSSVSCGFNHSIAMDIKGEVYCWGESPGACDVPPNIKFTMVRAGNGFSVGVTQTGSVLYWGNFIPGDDDPLLATNVMSIDCFVGPGSSSFGALFDDGRIRTWRSEGATSNSPKEEIFQALAVGGSFTVGLTENHQAIAWTGSSGIGPDFESALDITGQTLKQIDAGTFHSVGLRFDGSVVCFGPNLFGECSQPGGIFTEVAAGSVCTLGLRRDGSVVVWGGESDPGGGAIFGPGQPPTDIGELSAVSAGGLFAVGINLNGSCCLEGSCIPSIEFECAKAGGQFVYGPCTACFFEGCEADVTGNGDVGLTDLIAVLSNWGPCPE